MTCPHECPCPAPSNACACVLCVVPTPSCRACLTQDLAKPCFLCLPRARCGGVTCVALQSSQGYGNGVSTSPTASLFKLGDFGLATSKTAASGLTEGDARWVVVRWVVILCLRALLPAACVACCSCIPEPAPPAPKAPNCSAARALPLYLHSLTPCAQPSLTGPNSNLCPLAPSK